MSSPIFLFVFAMWILLIIGGGIVVLILGPISVSGFGEFDQILSSGIKAIVAFALVITWIFVLSKLKNWMFKKQISF